VLATQIKGKFLDGSDTVGRVVTDVLRVSPDGNDADGRSWYTAYNDIQTALDAASTDVNDCTLIMLAPHTTFYDINTSGAPTWSGNYEIIGTHRTWAPIRNTNRLATSIMKFTGKTSIRDLAIFQTGTVDGVIFTNSGFRIRKCGFNSEALSGAGTSIYIDGTAGFTHGGIIEDIQILGNDSYTKGLYVNFSQVNEFNNMHIHRCLTGIQVSGSDSDYNTFYHTDIGDCALGIDIVEGNEQHFSGLILHHNTVNVADAIGDSTWMSIVAELDVTLEPDNFTGISVGTHLNGDTWTTSPVEIRSAASATVPFKIVATISEASAAEKFRIRFSSDSGLTWFDDISIEGELNAQKRESHATQSDTDYIFNKGTQIVAAAKCENGDESVNIWLEIQEI